MSFVSDIFHSGYKDSSYCDLYHIYITTGKLKFILNYKLQDLLSKGPNNCEDKTINHKKCKESINNLLLLSIESLSSEYNLTKSAVIAWYDAIISEIRFRHIITNNPLFCER